MATADLPPPGWLAPLGEAPPLDAAVAALSEALGGDAPPHLCAQCFDPPFAAKTLAALRALERGAVPETAAWAQVFFEHPDCVGGEGVVRLVLVPGLRLWADPADAPRWLRDAEVLGTALRAGLWYWPAAQRAALRDVALRLARDFFEAGRRAWHPAEAPVDHVADDLLHLLGVAQVDPAAVVAWLAGLHTVEADAGMTLAAHGLAVEPPFYVAAETGPAGASKPYAEACAAMARVMEARAGEAALAALTPDWFDAAFFRRERDAPDLAAELSDLARDWSVWSTRLARWADRPAGLARPDLPVID
ncbi:hypothetical protein JQC91_14190 [Jannaschia sp. Os4]|uniref:hypothetical protein n=1 Tax=Jannaschia sp. Os4 TaxID=2807617 RepID=UPI00193959B8|nr:hypothetical protein [Jannaschia sp. Os4]MBM2577453.1 hypothetical protein [Jannaschia sp. Os4]